MGRLTIFAINDCPHCAKAKGIFKKHGMEYTEINLDDYPSKRSDMLKLSKSLTVPQIFFNDKHVGGASDVAKLDSSGELAQLWEDLQNAPSGPANAMLEIPTWAPTPKPKPSPRAEEYVQLGAEKLSVIEAVKAIESNLSSPFTVGQLIDFLSVTYYNHSTGKDVVKGAMQLASLGVIKSLEDDYGLLGDDEDQLGKMFTLVKAQNGNCLNEFRIWQDRVDDPMVVVTTLKKRIGSILSKHRDDQGLVDYVAALRDAEFAEFQEASCELQKIDMASMNVNTRKAFGINLYNLMVSHAFAQVGAPSNACQRVAFFPKIGYNVGGQFYSFDDLESGVLRGNVNNKGGPGPFPPGDPRIRCALEKRQGQIDNRIHFALNCGAKSCPPVKKFSADAVNEELAIVGQAFFQQPENCKLAPVENLLYLSKILMWYASDFGTNHQEIAKAVLEHLSDERKHQLELMMAKKGFKIKYMYYDWSNDASRTIPFSGCGFCTIM